MSEERVLSVTGLKIGEILDTVVETKDESELESFLRNEIRKLKDAEIVKATKKSQKKEILIDLIICFKQGIVQIF